MIDLLFFIPELFLLVSICVLFVFAIICSSKDLQLRVVCLEHSIYFSVLCLLCCLVLYYFQLSLDALMLDGSVSKNFVLISSILFILSLNIVSFAILLAYVREDILKDFEINILFLFILFSMITFILSNDMMLAYVALELFSLSMYVLATSKSSSWASTEAGLKYFVIGSVASCFFLFGVSLLYVYTGFTNFSDLYLYFELGFVGLDMVKGTLISLLFILVPLLLKIGVAPFHLWVPDVYEGAPTAIVSFFATVPKFVMVVFLIRLCYGVLLDIVNHFVLILTIVGLLSIIVGSFGALQQVWVKRLVAYSAIGHIGYLLLAMAGGDFVGLSGVFIYLFIYVMLTVNMFSVILSLRCFSDFKLVRNIASLYNLYDVNKPLVLSLCLVLFSLAGIPPLAGFFSKLYVFYALVFNGYFITIGLVIILSVISVVYYLQFIGVLFFYQASSVIFLKPVNDFLAVLIAYTTVGSIIFCMYPRLVLDFVIVMISFGFL